MDDQIKLIGLISTYGIDKIMRFTELMPVLYPIIQEYELDPLQDESWERAYKVARERYGQEPQTVPL